MDLFRLKIIKILVLLNMPPKDIFNLRMLSREDIIEHLFHYSLDKKRISECFMYFTLEFSENYLELLKPHFKTVIQTMEFPEYYILDCYQAFGLNFILEHKEEIAISLSSYQYSNIMDKLYKQEKDMKTWIKKLTPLLYQFYDAMNHKNKYDAALFASSILFSMEQVHADEYLEYIKQKVFLNRPLEIEYLKQGSSSYAFDVNGKIVKFGDRRKSFFLIMHYRMNDFYIRKKFETKQSNIILEVCPKGDLSQVTTQDIEASLYDFNQAGLVLLDPHYNQNFAYFEGEPKLHFQEVDGILEYRKAPFSKSYQKRKVKLIDQEYVYDQKTINI